MKEKVEFDSKVTEKDLIKFKLYANYTSVGGIFGLIFAVVELIVCFVSIGRTEISYTLMLATFGLLFLLYPPISSILSAKKQIKKIPAFAAAIHYTFDADGIRLIQGEIDEKLEWQNVYKIKIANDSLLIYLTTINANIIPIRDCRDSLTDIVSIAKTNLKPFQVKISEKKVSKLSEKK